MKSLFAALFLALSLLLMPVAGHCQQPGAVLQPGQAGPPEIRDIQGPVLLPEGPPVFLILGLAALTLAAVLAAIIIARRRRKSAIVKPGPDEIALKELELAGQLQGQPLLYAERVSAILRQYIESRFQIRSTRQTTREFFSRLQEGCTLAEVDLRIHAGDLQECMEQCDRAKFAHGIPDQDLSDMDRAVRKFIETTRPIPDRQPQGQTAGNLDP